MKITASIGQLGSRQPEISLYVRMDSFYRGLHKAVLLSLSHARLLNSFLKLTAHSDGFVEKDMHACVCTHLRFTLLLLFKKPILSGYAI